MMYNLTISAVNKLKQKFPEIVDINVRMDAFSHWRIGGRLSVLITPRNEGEVMQVRRWIYVNNLPYFTIGNTTNLLFCDDEIRAIAIKLDGGFNDISVEGDTVIAQSGVYVPCLARRAMHNNLSGLEHICGIPGTLGGLVVMNGGSQRKGIGEAINYVKTITENGEVRIYHSEDCAFSYRASIFQSNKDFITEVGLKLRPVADKWSIHKDMFRILRSRSTKFPRKQPSCGSSFISDPAMYEKYGPPGKIIEDCGLKGIVKGGAQISPAHANFIVNKGGAKAEDILYLIQLVKNEVYKRTGFTLKVEAKFVDAYGQILCL